MASETPTVEPASVVVGNSHWQNLAFPRSRSNLETFELCHNCIERLCSRHFRLRRYVLPREQKPQEVTRRDWFDLRAQPLKCVVVDPRQEPALTPFIGTCAGRKTPAQGEAFQFKRRERDRDFV